MNETIVLLIAIVKERGVNTLPGKKLTEKKLYIPDFFPKQAFDVGHNAPKGLVETFNLFQPHFAQLATAQVFAQLKPYLIEVDISEEIKNMHADSALEITVPVIGITDLFNDSLFSQVAPQFSTVMGVNGYGAKAQNVTADNFPRADYVMVTDIVGNRYEVFVNAQGGVELPQEGTGLFSTISAMTFIYSAAQIQQGVGLEKVTSQGMLQNRVYLLPPIDAREDFSVKVCVSHLNTQNRRIVDSVRTVEIKFDAVFQNVQPHCMLKHLENDAPELCYIDIQIPTVSCVARKPFTLNVTIEPIEGVNYHFSPSADYTVEAEAHGFSQHPVLPNVFTKHYGLSEPVLKTLVEHCYTPYDFMKEPLEGGSFTLSQHQGYNDFLLRPEAFKKLYPLIIKGLVAQAVPMQFLWDRISEERLVKLNLSEFSTELQDNVVLNHIQAEFAEHRFETFKGLFLEKNIQQNNMIEDYCYLYASGIKEKLPQVDAQMHWETTLTQDLLSLIEVNKHDDKIIHLDDIMDTSSLINAPWIDFGNAFEKENIARAQERIQKGKATRVRTRPVSEPEPPVETKDSTWIPKPVQQQDARPSLEAPKPPPRGGNRPH